jgi:hypothetical protein
MSSSDPLASRDSGRLYDYLFQVDRFCHQAMVAAASGPLDAHLWETTAAQRFRRDLPSMPIWSESEVARITQQMALTFYLSGTPDRCRRPALPAVS